MKLALNEPHIPVKKSCTSLFGVCDLMCLFAVGSARKRGEPRTRESTRPIPDGTGRGDVASEVREGHLPVPTYQPRLEPLSAKLDSGRTLDATKSHYHCELCGGNDPGIEAPDPP